MLIGKKCTFTDFPSNPSRRLDEDGNLREMRGVIVAGPKLDSDDYFVALVLTQCNNGDGFEKVYCESIKLTQ